MKIFGPVFWYELKQIARRQRLALSRALFATLLLVALFFLYSTTFRQAGLFRGQVIRPAQLSEMASFAASVFATFTALQFAVVILLTPALAANSLAEERSRDTLVFLLTTQLSSREIILGKLFTRLLQVAMIVLTSLPMLGFLQLFGGVDQLLIVASFVGVGITALSLGCLGMLCAVYVKNPQRAAWRAYQWIVVYLLISMALVFMYDLPNRGFRWVSFGNTTFFVPRANFRYSASLNVTSTSFADGALEMFNVGNPLYAGRRIAFDLAGNMGIADAVVPAMRDYLIFHGLLAIGCLSIAIARLRAVSARQISGLTFKKSIYLKPAPHPPVKDRPVLWKEYYCESKPRQRWAAMFFSKWFFFISFLPAWIFIVLSLQGDWHTMYQWIMAALSFGGTLVAGGLLARVAMQAARSIGSERERQTLDCLLTTELPADEILRDKWWGSLLSGRWVFLWLLIHWALGVLTMAIGFLPALFLIAEIVVFGSFMVSLGLYCSVRCATTKLAVSRTLLAALIGTVVVPWLLGQVLTVMTTSWLGMGGPQPDRDSYYYGPPPGRTAPEAISIALSPIQLLYNSVSPHALWPGGYGYYDMYDRNRWSGEILPAAVLGLAVYWLLGTILWRHARGRFRRSFGVQATEKRLPAKDLREHTDR